MLIGAAPWLVRLGDAIVLSLLEQPVTAQVRANR
jgi:hypothetical protein